LEVLGCLPDEALERIDRIERTVNPDCLLEIEAYYSIRRQEEEARRAQHR
jgi:hypothetical protein